MFKANPYPGNIVTILGGTLALLWAFLSHATAAEQNSHDNLHPLEPVWQRAIGGYGLEKASAGMVLPDGTFMIAGEMTADEDAANSDGVVIAVSPSGEILWRQQYGDERHDTAHGIIAAGKDPQNGFFVIGDRSGDADNLWMLRIGPDGALSWSRDLPDDEGAFNRYIFNMPQAEDGSFFVVGQARSRADATHTRGFVIRLDAEGNILWQRKYGNGRANTLHNIRLLPDGGLLGIGRTNDTIDKHEAAWVLRLDNNGKVLWEKKYGDYVFQQLRSAIALKGGFVISGDAVPKDDGPQQGWILQLDKDGEFVNETFLANEFDQYCYDIQATENDGYAVLCDMDHRIDGDTDAIALYGFDAEKRLVSSWIVNGAGDDTAFRLFNAPEGDLFVLGTTTSRPLKKGDNQFTDVADDYDIWVFRVNSKKFTP